MRRLNKCGVISPRFDVRHGQIEDWVAKLLPSRLVSFPPENHELEEALPVLKCTRNVARCSRGTAFCRVQGAAEASARRLSLASEIE